MILTGIAIDEAVGRGEIVIDPYDQGQLRHGDVDERGQIQPGSYDVRLGDEVAVYDRWVDVAHERQRTTPDGFYLHSRGGSAAVLDVKEGPAITKFKIGAGGWVLWPDIGYLMHTKERISTSMYNPIIDGKSSTGRLFISVHQTAGYGDPAFDGQYTLEVTCKHPVRVYADMLFAQVRFHRMQGRVLPYKGNYTGEAARGPVASRAWKQFKEKV